VSDDEARALVRRWWDVWRDGDLAIVEELCTDPFTRHTGMGTERLGLEEYKRKLVQTQRILRGAVTTIDDEVVVGDRVWSRATSRGVNIEHLDRSVMTWMVIHRIEDGRIAEVWAATLPGVEWERGA
jgi:ketosteroid isomerase-like protein